MPSNAARFTQSLFGGLGKGVNTGFRLAEQKKANMDLQIKNGTAALKHIEVLYGKDSPPAIRQRLQLTRMMVEPDILGDLPPPQQSPELPGRASAEIPVNPNLDFSRQLPASGGSLSVESQAATQAGRARSNEALIKRQRAFEQSRARSLGTQSARPPQDKAKQQHFKDLHQRAKKLFTQRHAALSGQAQPSIWGTIEPKWNEAMQAELSNVLGDLRGKHNFEFPSSILQALNLPALVSNGGFGTQSPQRSISTGAPLDSLPAGQPLPGVQQSAVAASTAVPIRIPQAATAPGGDLSPGAVQVAEPDEHGLIVGQVYSGRDGRRKYLGGGRFGPLLQ